MRTSYGRAGGGRWVREAASLGVALLLAASDARAQLAPGWTTGVRPSANGAAAAPTSTPQGFVTVGLETWRGAPAADTWLRGVQAEYGSRRGRHGLSFYRVGLRSSADGGSDALFLGGGGGLHFRPLHRVSVGPSGVVGYELSRVASLAVDAGVRATTEVRSWQAGIDVQRRVVLLGSSGAAEVLPARRWTVLFAIGTVFDE